MTKFKDVAHLYLGCQIQLADFRLSEPIEDNSYTLHAVSRTGFTIDNPRLEYDFSIDYKGNSNDKPILRPLSSMTEDEKKEAASFVTQKEANKAILCTVKFEAMKYLLEKHFDLFDLIKTGEALEATPQPA